MPTRRSSKGGGGRAGTPHSGRRRASRRGRRGCPARESRRRPQPRRRLRLRARAPPGSASRRCRRSRSDRSGRRRSRGAARAPRRAPAARARRSVTCSAAPVCSRTAARILTRSSVARRAASTWRRLSSSIGMWQRMKWPGSTSTSGGSSFSQIAPELSRAARVEDAARGRVGGARDLALEADPRSLRRPRAWGRPRGAPPYRGGAGP